MTPTRIGPKPPTRLLDGAPYANAASHTSSEGLRERFAKINPSWNRKPGAKVILITRQKETQ